MSVFIGFIVGLVAGAIASALLAMPVFDFLDSFAALIAIVVFAAVWYGVYKRLEGRDRLV